jgi:hypothetical protein
MENILFQTYQFLEGHVLTQASLLLENSTFSSKSSAPYNGSKFNMLAKRSKRSQQIGEFSNKSYA